MFILLLIAIIILIIGNIIIVELCVERDEIGFGLVLGFVWKLVVIMCTITAGTLLKVI